MPATLSHPNLGDGVEARAYQLLAAKEALTGSTLLVMPTGLGKTAVQWMAMAEAMNGKGRIVLVAPTTGLVAQQTRMARDMLNIDEDKVVMLTGDVRPKKRCELWNDAKLVMATPHVIRNDAQNGLILLSEIDLLIFDEAHHATGSDSMAQLADLYLEASPSAMVLAATASPGVKEAKVREVITRLGIERLCVSRREDDLLAPYVTAMDIEKHEISLPENLLSIIRPLRMLEAEEAEFLRRGGYLIRKGRITTAAIDEAQKRASASIGRGDPRGYDAARRIGDLRRLHRLLDLIETQGVQCAIQYLDRARNDSDRKTKRFLGLSEVSSFHRTCKGMDEIHPKSQLVIELATKGLKKDGKIIIFTEYRDTVDLLISTLEQMDGVRPGRFVGQTSKAGNIGMKQKEQIAQLDRFRNGELNVLVATSVGEEGLDVPAADSVILYEPVPSAIRAIQRRGRTARQRDGDVHILIARNTRDDYVQHASLKREEAMYRTLNRLQRQRFLPRRTPPSDDVLSDFKVDGIDAEEFINSEKIRLKREPVIPVEEEVIEAPKTQSKFQSTNRPRSQKGLFDFNAPSEANSEEWWRPVLDGSSSPSRIEEAAAAAAAQTEADGLTESNEGPLISLDHREGQSTLPAMLKLHGHDIKIETLPVGDVRISDRIIIERKSARDLVDSLIDGRLIHQARRLLGAAARPLLIIESTETERVHPNAVMGAMAWITLDLGLPVLMTGGSEATARFISIAARREARILDLLSGNSRPKSLDAETTTIEAASREIRAIMEGEQSEGPLAKRWSEEVMATRCRLLAELPGIGMKTARCIMQEVESISALCQLSEQSLASIDGVSPQQAKELHRFLVG